MIKDKITPEIKNRFKEAIQETIKTGQEHAFLICKDQTGNLSPTHIIKGVETRIRTGVIKCPFKTQGNFHTHADVSNIKKSFFKDEKVPIELVQSIVKKLAEKEGVDVTTPSHPDALAALLNKCLRRTEGTVCIGSDATPDRVDCWTIKEDFKKNCREAIIRFEKEKNEHIPPKDWIKPLFNKERIDLKR